MVSMRPPFEADSIGQHGQTFNERAHFVHISCTSGPAGAKHTGE
jgi:hypothetical protein